MKIIKNKFAQSGSSLQLPMQAFIEIVLIASIGLAVVAYGAYIVKDTRLHQTFLVKDISFLQNSLILTDHDVNVIYIPNDKSRFHEFIFDFKSLHTDILSNDDNNNVLKSYIHFIRPEYQFTGTFKNNGKLYFSKVGDKYLISNTTINNKIIMNCPDVSSFSEDLQKGFFFFENMQINMHFDNLNKFLLNKESFERLPDTSIKFYISFIEVDRESIVLFVPSGDKEKFACELYNKLSKDYDVVYIKVNDQNSDLNNYNYAVKIYAKGPYVIKILDYFKEIING